MLDHQPLSIREAVSRLYSVGITPLRIRPKAKAPVETKWADRPRKSLRDFLGSIFDGENIGVRYGSISRTDGGLYLYGLDVDIRDPAYKDEVLAELTRLLPDWRDYPRIATGSGGESFHVWFLADKDFRSAKLAKSDEFEMVWDDQKGREVKKNKWEIDFLGSGKQGLVPPSVHPSGGSYTWAREPDFDDLLGLYAPIVDTDTIDSWGAPSDHYASDEEDDLLATMRGEPLGLDFAEIASWLEKLPPDWVDDRERWLQAGMAVSHETGGSAEGFEIWDAWSQQSVKYDPKDLWRVWRSFKLKNAERRRPLRMATIIGTARDHEKDKLIAEMRDVDRSFGPERDQIEDAEFEDLLGGSVAEAEP
jgi:hypothetical protein